jgi:hypothetical protein
VTMLLPPCEFRDPDGTYVLVQPFDEVRCRVIASNVAEKDQVLYKGDAIDWPEAAKDLGGFTRLGPCELLAQVDQELPDLGEDDAGFVPEDWGQAADALAQVEDPRTSRSHEQAEGADLQVAILRLAIHYQQVHERRDGETRWVTLCRCPGHAPAGDVETARLHAMVSVALLANELPSLHRIRGAIREAVRDQIEVA